MTMESLCASTGRQITSKPFEKSANAQSIVRNAMGVMRVDGMYALYLYLNSKKQDGKEIWGEISELLKNPLVGSPLSTAFGTDEEKLIKMTEDLYKVLLARQLCERALTYALYGLRIKGD